MSELLVSVRNADEALEAVAGGASVIDVKEPDRGPLGRADVEVIENVVVAVSRRCAISAAQGEFHESHLIQVPRGVNFFKIGLSGVAHVADWRFQLRALRLVTEQQTGARLVVVAYADWQRAASPEPYHVMEFAIRERLSAFLIDTWEKDGSTLLKWTNTEHIAHWRRRCHEGGIMLGLAGSLGRAEINKLLPVEPDFFAVRGAACVGGRQGTVSRERVAELAGLLSPPS